MLFKFNTQDKIACYLLSCSYISGKSDLIEQLVYISSSKHWESLRNGLTQTYSVRMSIFHYSKMFLTLFENFKHIHSHLPHPSGFTTYSIPTQLLVLIHLKIHQIQLVLLIRSWVCGNPLGHVRAIRSHTKES